MARSSQRGSNGQIHFEWPWMVADRGSKLIVHSPQTGPASGPSADGGRPSVDNVQRCALTLEPHVLLPSHALCVHILMAAFVSRTDYSLLPQRRRPLPQPRSLVKHSWRQKVCNRSNSTALPRTLSAVAHGPPMRSPSQVTAHALAGTTNGLTASGGMDRHLCEGRRLPPSRG